MVSVLIVNVGPNQLELTTLPLPDPKAGQVRIQTAACGICATDLSMIEGWERTGFPAIPGHEWSGIVESVGSGVVCRVDRAPLRGAERSR